MTDAIYIHGHYFEADRHVQACTGMPGRARARFGMSLNSSITSALFRVGNICKFTEEV